MKKINCWLKGIWRSLPQWLRGDYPISGHLFVDTEEHEGCKVMVGKCEHCGKVSITWSGGREIYNRSSEE